MNYLFSVLQIGGLKIQNYLDKKEERKVFLGRGNGVNIDLKFDVIDRKYCWSVMSHSGKVRREGNRLQGYYVRRGVRIRW